ncbi:hypothetical protein [Paenibacillus wuxiensis]|uniref:hypothetical protein n=1 Tax=Paenibacillaceae bacterium P-4 TaxID=3160969 RepID=UPI00406B9595
MHSEVEVYNTMGKHLGVMTPEGGWHPQKGQDKRITLKASQQKNLPVYFFRSTI